MTLPGPLTVPHEAGHAVTAWALGFQLEAVKTGGDLHDDSGMPVPGLTLAWLPCGRPRAVGAYALAGYVGAVMAGEDPKVSWGTSWGDYAAMRAHSPVTGARLDAVGLGSACDLAMYLLTRYGAQWEALTGALAAAGEMTGGEVTALLGAPGGLPSIETAVPHPAAAGVLGGIPFPAGERDRQGAYATLRTFGLHPASAYAMVAGAEMDAARARGFHPVPEPIGAAPTIRRQWQVRKRLAELLPVRWADQAACEAAYRSLAPPHRREVAGLMRELAGTCP